MLGDWLVNWENLVRTVPRELLDREESQALLAIEAKLGHLVK